ncbi:MAG: 4-hydroxy-tetrahydrodipicolinate reductase [Myxococcales bacterium]|nr:4-hydroxy-tetrahydrodipicolinate reductase [Myxococcales bacterium]
MGRAVLREVLEAPDLELVAAVTHAGSAHLHADAGVLAGLPAVGIPVTPIGPVLAEADVVVDFALPSGTLAALPHLGSAALVSGTTGLEPTDRDRVLGHGAVAPVLLAANFSVGVNALLALVEAAARSLPDFDVEVVEAHHRRKVDAPSGTALALARAAADARGVDLERVRQDGRVGRTGPRRDGAIGLHALRGGSVTGHHTVWLAGEGERLELTHEAASREVFARGAVRAARWIAGRPPRCYSMRDVLGL